MKPIKLEGELEWNIKINGKKICQKVCLPNTNSLDEFMVKDLFELLAENMIDTIEFFQQKKC